ncbi:hypothetical protein D3C77_655700 [compost metagenome]
MFDLFKAPVGVFTHGCFTREALLGKRRLALSQGIAYQCTDLLCSEFTFDTDDGAAAAVYGALLNVLQGLIQGLKRPAGSTKKVNDCWVELYAHRSAVRD